jgi:hypothetical protein
MLDATIGEDPADPATHLPAGQSRPKFMDVLQAKVLTGARIGILEPLFGGTFFTLTGIMRGGACPDEQPIRQQCGPCKERLQQDRDRQHYGSERELQRWSSALRQTSFVKPGFVADLHTVSVRVADVCREVVGTPFGPKARFLV